MASLRSIFCSRRLPLVYPHQRDTFQETRITKAEKIRNYIPKRVAKLIHLIPPPPVLPDSAELVAGRQGGGVIASLHWWEGLREGVKWHLV